MALFLRSAAGVLDSCPAVSKAGLSDIIAPSLRGVVFTWLGAIFSLGRVLSSGLGGLLSGVYVLGGEFVLPSLCGAAFSLIAMFVVIFGMPETRKKEHRHAADEPSLLEGFRTVCEYYYAMSC